MDPLRLLDVLDEVAAAVRRALDDLDDWGPSGVRPGQYNLDLAADAAALPILHGAGLAVHSEESGATGDVHAPLLAVIDPVDGSTNAHRGIPFYCTSICVLDAEGPLAGLVVNQDSGLVFSAAVPWGWPPPARQGLIVMSGCTALSSAVVGVISSWGGIRVGLQFRHGGGCAGLCAVASGALDAEHGGGRVHAVRLGLPGRDVDLP